jgi:hypothetical protein
MNLWFCKYCVLVPVFLPVWCFSAHVFLGTFSLTLLGPPLPRCCCTPDRDAGRASLLLQAISTILVLPDTPLHYYIIDAYYFSLPGGDASPETSRRTAGKLPASLHERYPGPVSWRSARILMRAGFPLRPCKSFGNRIISVTDLDFC